MTRDERRRHEEADARARAVVREALKDNLFVEAGAGTGKTSALVDRVVSLVLAGRPVERIVAITFTERAAAELRDRVRASLEAYAPASEAEKARVEAALAALDRARISTIHAFCSALLRAFAAEAGVDPAFEVQDEVAAGRRFEERWRAYLEALGADAAAVHAVDRALDLGLTPDDLHALARALWQRQDLAPLLSAAPLTATAPPWPVIDDLHREVEALARQRAGPHDALAERLDTLLAALAAVRDAPDNREAALAAAVAGLTTRLNVGRQQNWGGSAAINRVRARAGEVVATLKDLLAGLRSGAMCAVLPYAVRFILDDLAERGREGLLVFDDLILRLRDLLREEPGARAVLREQHDTLLIDEFQDTDPLQVEIAWAFATDPATGVLEPGRLFLVGDPKQSVYRFRRADMAVYAATKRNTLAGGASEVELALNRRSRDVLLDVVNPVFRNVIGAGGQPSLQPPYRDVHPLRDERLAGPGVAWFGGQLALKAREARREEARALAAHCRAAVEAGWEVAERRGDSFLVRRARFSDLAVLIPTRAILQPLERAFADASVPYRVEGGSLVYGTQEMRDIINCLAAIDDPADEVAVVAALRSPAYACSDVEIASYRLNGGSFNYLNPALDNRAGRVAEALRGLRHYHASRHDGSLARLVERFVTDRSLAEVAIVDTGSRNGFRRARYAIEQARVFERSRPESLRAFVQWLERRADEAVQDLEGAGLDDDEDAVRVLTVHAAKGLEFPVVFVAGLGVGPPTRPPVIVVDRASNQIGVRLGSSGREFLAGPYIDLKAAEDQHEEKERARLMYVAATRARDHLVFSLYRQERSDKSFASLLVAGGLPRLAAELPAAPAAAGAVAPPLAGLRVEDATPLAGFDDARARLVEASLRQPYTSATAIRLGDEEAEDERLARPDESEPWARGRGGTRLGRAVHAAIQSVAWDADDAAIEVVARAQAVAEAVPHRAADVASLVRRALASRAAARARGARRALREAPFAFRHRDRIVEGFIDLVIEDERGLEVVDWKTDQVPPQAVEERLRAYEVQAGIYVLALQQATGRPVHSVTYVFVSAGVERSPGAPDALAANAARQLSG